MFKKIMQYLLVAVAAFAFTVPVAAAQETKPAVVKVKPAKKAPVTKAVTLPAQQQVAEELIFEMMWHAGSPEHQAAYQSAVNRIVGVYVLKMDNHCRASVDVSDAVRAYGVYTLPGTEGARDLLIKRQVASLACATMYNDGAERAAKLRM